MKLRNMFNLKVVLLAPFSFKPASVVMLRMRCLATQQHHIKQELNKLKSKQNYSKIVSKCKLIECSDIYTAQHAHQTRKSQPWHLHFYHTLNQSYLCNTSNVI